MPTLTRKNKHPNKTKENQHINTYGTIKFFGMQIDVGIGETDLRDFVIFYDLFHILDKFVDSFGKMIFLKSLDVFAKKFKEEGC